MTAGSSIQAMIRTAPPQAEQISIPNTRFRPCAPVIEARFSAAVGASPSAARPDSPPLPRPAGVTRPRSLLLRANTPWKRRGFVYLTAVIDWASRKVLARRVAITLEACHAVEVLTEAFARHGTPDIVNTDQGSQFTAAEFTETVTARGCQISMDGRGAWRDNVFVERLWRTVKYEEGYLHAYDTVADAKTGIAAHLDWYSRDRPHSSLKRLATLPICARTPDEAYYALLPAQSLAA